MRIDLKLCSFHIFPSEHTREPTYILRRRLTNVPAQGATQSTVRPTFSGAHGAVGRLALALALLVRHITAAGELAVFPEPSITTDTAATRAEAVA